VRTIVNFIIVCVLLAGGLVTAIARPDSRDVVENLVISWPDSSKYWIEEIATAPYRWGFYLAATLSLLLWLRPRK